MLERGNTNVNFNSQNLTNGIYVVSLLCDGVGCGAIKMIVEK
jgi:hypothetical protein